MTKRRDGLPEDSKSPDRLLIEAIQKALHTKAEGKDLVEIAEETYSSYAFMSGNDIKERK